MLLGAKTGILASRGFKSLPDLFWHYSGRSWRTSVLSKSVGDSSCRAQEYFAKSLKWAAMTFCSVRIDPRSTLSGYTYEQSWLHKSLAKEVLGVFFFQAF